MGWKRYCRSYPIYPFYLAPFYLAVRIQDSVYSYDRVVQVIPGSTVEIAAQRALDLALQHGQLSTYERANVGLADVDTSEERREEGWRCRRLLCHQVVHTLDVPALQVPPICIDRWATREFSPDRLP